MTNPTAPQPADPYSPAVLAAHPIRVTLDCRGTNPACRKARRAGRPVHVSPPPFVNGGAHRLVMDTYHYATEREGRDAIAAAEQTAPIVETDDQLYALRAARSNYRLVPGWIDPSRR